MRQRRCLFKWLKLSWRKESKLVLTRDSSWGSLISSGTFSKLLCVAAVLIYCLLINVNQTISIYCIHQHEYMYKGRCGLPTNFDATYCYALGYGAGVLLNSGKTGLISSVCTPSFFIQISLLMYLLIRTVFD